VGPVPEDEPDDDGDDLERELAELEDELADLEEEDADAPDPDEDDGGLLGGLTDAIGGDEDDEPPEDAAEETDAPEAEDDDGLLGGLSDRFGGDTEEDEAPDPEPEDEAPAAPDEPEPAEETDAPEPPAPEPEPGRAEEAKAPEDEAPTPREKAASPRWERTEDGWRRRDPDEVEAAGEADDEPDEDAPDPGGLLSRFRGEGDDEPEPAPATAREKLGPPRPTEDEESGFPVLLVAGIVGAVLLLALIAGAAALLLGGGPEITADVTSSALQEEGAFVAATGQAIELDAGDSSGPVEEYRWDFGDGETTTTSEPSVEHAFATRGAYTVTLTAAAEGTTSEATLEVRVFDAPDPQPEVLVNGSAAAEPGSVGNNPLVGQTVTLDASGSSVDQDREATSYEWDVDGDGSPDATGEQTTASFDAAGAWDVELTLTDDLGNEATATRSVGVADEVAFENETIGPAVPQAVSQLHNVTVDAGRGNAAPVQLDAVLVYQASEDAGDVDADPQPDLDLSVESPAGTVYEAEDDQAEGREELMVSESEIDAIGTWAFNVTQDQQDSVVGSGSEAEYSLTVRTVY
jgi:PKD repeat protein